MQDINYYDFEKVYPLEEMFLDVSIAFSLQTPDKTVNKFRRALEKIKENGTHATILKKYMPNL